MPNSVVKRNSADGSVGLPHVRVGHRQALNFVFTFVKVKKTVKEPVQERAFLVLKDKRFCVLIWLSR